MAQGYIKTDYVDVIDKATGAKVMEIDLSRGINEGAKQFAAWWNDGILLRAVDPTAPAPTASEVMTIAMRDGMGAFAALDGYDFNQRYTDARTGRIAYPEPHSEVVAGMVRQVAGVDGYAEKNATVRGIVSQVHAMCTQVVHTAPRRQQEQRREIVAGFADTQAKRYQEGLERVQALNAQSKLRAEILAVEDADTRHKLMAEYPELFDGQAAQDMAEDIRMETYDADVAAWQAARTPEGDADAAHGHDTTGTNYVQGTPDFSDLAGE